MAWIKFDKDLINDPRVVSAAEYLAETYVVSVEGVRGSGFAVGEDLGQEECIQFFCNAVTGALLALWVYADTHIRAGDVLPISAFAVDRLVGIREFCEIIDEEWLTVSDDGKHVILPGYCDKNGLITKQTHKALNASRQRRFREKEAFEKARRNNAPDNALRNALVTPLDQDQDQDQDQDLKPKPKVAPLVLPEWLDKTKWKSYVETRSARGRKTASLKAALERLEKFRAAGHDPNEIIATTLANGWQGLFEPKVNGSSSGPAWWTSDATILAKAGELGLTPRGGESYSQLKGRIEIALRGGE